MRLWAILAAILVSTLVLAGCSDKKDDGDDASSSTSSTSRASTPGTTTAPPTTSASTPTQPPTGPPGEPDNTAPVGSIAAVPANASILPRTINFTLNGTDAEGDNIVWDFTFGDGNATSGAILPANVSHQYAAVGLYNVTFTISDGRLQTTYNLTVNVTAGGGGGAVLFTLVGSTVAPNPFMSAPIPMAGSPGASFCFGLAASANPAESTSGLDCVFAELPPGLAGTFTATSSAGNSEVEFWDTCDPTAAASTGSAIGAGEATGPVPAGSGCVILWDAADAADLTFAVIG